MSLAEVIGEKLDGGTLPHDDPVLLWPGIGSGKACSACGRPILRAQTEFVPQWEDDRPIVVFHLECHGYWQAERRLRRYQRPKPEEEITPLARSRVLLDLYHLTSHSDVAGPSHSETHEERKVLQGRPDLGLGVIVEERAGDQNTMQDLARGVVDDSSSFETRRRSSTKE